MRRNPIIHGTLVLSGAMLINRILGALYRIPLTRLIGDEGLGLYQMVYPIYAIVAILSTWEIPIASSKLIAEKRASQDWKGVLQIFKVSVTLLLLTGTAGSFLLYLGARFLASEVLNEPRTYYAIISISPGILFMAVASAFHGFFRGMERMTPNAISAIIEEIARITAMLFLGYTFMARGIEYAAAGIALGTLSGGIAGILAFLWPYVRERYIISQKVQEGPLQGTGRKSNQGPLHRRPGDKRNRHGRGGDTSTGLLSQLFSLATPLVLSGLIGPIFQSIEVMLIPAKLKSAGFNATDVVKLYGQLTAMALPCLYFPTILTGALATNLMPSIAGAMATKEIACVRRRTRQALRVTSLIGFPSSAMLFLLADELCGLLFALPAAGTALRPLAAGCFFICLIQVTGGILHGLGDTIATAKHRLAGSLVRIALIYLLGGIPGLSITGVTLAYTGGFAVMGSLNLLRLSTHIKGSIDLQAFLIKPGLSTILAALFLRPVYMWVSAGTSSILMGVVVSILVAASIYLTLLLIMEGISRRDILLIPGLGLKMARILEWLGLLP